MTTTLQKARKILTNVLTHIEFTGNLKTTIHVYNIAVELDNTNPKSKIDRALNALFDITEGKRTSDTKAATSYLKTIKSIA